MTLEIVGARLIAPYFGTSTYVWTAMIGVILGSLAVGYILGGVLADSKAMNDLLPHIILMSASLILWTGMIQDSQLASIAAKGFDLRLGALLSALILFGPPSLFLGMISPYLAKKRITELSSTGRSFGRLEAAGAIGSIVGTFGCGYFLLGWVGSEAIVIGVVLLLLATSLLADIRLLWRARIAIVVISLLVAIGINYDGNTLADVDSAYARYRVIEGVYDTQPVRMLLTDNSSIQSAVTVEEPHKLVFKYLEGFNYILDNFEGARDILVVGGGTYTFPSFVAREHPEISVDAVEIDPKLKELARQYFYYKDRPNLKIIHEDGRTYINRQEKLYDLIFLDAFNNINPPFHLTTTEMLKNTQENLRPNGVVVTNLIGKISESENGYLGAAVATYKEVFKNVAVYPADISGNLKNSEQNFLIVASNSQPEDFQEALTGPGEPILTNGDGLVLTDNYAPIERLMRQD